MYEEQAYAQQMADQNLQMATGILEPESMVSSQDPQAFQGQEYQEMMYYEECKGKCYEQQVKEVYFSIESLDQEWNENNWLGYDDSLAEHG